MNTRNRGTDASKFWALMIAGAVLLGCSSGVAEPQSDLPVVQACFVSEAGTAPVQLEVASTPEQRRKGLMHRTSLASDAGMLFVYPETREASHGFWMYQTLIPLDIAYVNDQGVIGSIRHMIPCTGDNNSACPSYPAGVPFSKAVEMNAGFFRQHDLRPGDRFQVSCEP